MQPRVYYYVIYKLAKDKNYFRCSDSNLETLDLARIEKSFYEASFQSAGKAASIKIIEVTETRKEVN